MNALDKALGRLDLISRATALPIKPARRSKILITLALHANPDGSNCYPSLDTLTSITGFDRRDIQRDLRALEEDGWIARMGNVNGGRSRTVIYQLNIPAGKGQQMTFDILGGISPALSVPPKGGNGTPKGRETPPLKGGKNDDAIRSTLSDHKEETLNTAVPAAGDQNHTAHGAALIVQSWLKIKSAMQQELPQGEWDSLIRPARVLKDMGGNTLLVAFPPNRAILRRAQEGKRLLNEIAGRFGYQILVTVYPDEWEKSEVKERFGVEYIGENNHQRKQKAQHAEADRAPPKAALA